MHPNPVFREMPDDTNLGFARERGFGVLSVNGPDGPWVAHVPFVLAQDGKTADLHLLRSNPISRACTAPLPAVIAVSGPDGYISPDWYDTPDQVPTWNYVAVHLRGQLEPLAQSELPNLLDRLSARFEEMLAPKPVWTRKKMAAGVAARMMRQIVPFRLRITQVDGTWKLGQNKPDSARRNAARHVAAYRLGQETTLLSGLMLPVPDDDDNR